jgi:acetone carboxylase gamma subunit
MALPKIDQPLFELEIPSTSKKAKYRPFTVKEEKILMIAQESKDMDQIILSIKQVINNCMPDVDVDTLSVFDLEYIILNIRAKSVNNEISFAFEDEETGEKVETVIDINDVKVQFNDEHSKKIDINDQYYMMMRYPSLEEVRQMQAVEEGSTEQMFATMISCIDTLVDESSDETFLPKKFRTL